MLSLLPLMNNSVTIGLTFLLAFISAMTSSNIINSFLSYSLLNLHRHYGLFVNNQQMYLDCFYF